MKKYFYSDGKEKFGPFSFEELKNENISKETLIWFEGLEDWKPAKEIKEFEKIFELTPPSIVTEDSENKSQINESNEISGETEFIENNRNAHKTKRQGMFSNPFSFKGRIRRTEYGISFIISAFLHVIINTLIQDSDEFAFLFLAYIPLYWFLFAQGAKRCHDMGNSGWFQIIPFYPIWMIFGKGEEGFSNKYGINPKI